MAARADEATKPSWRQHAILYGVVFAVGFAGLLIKRPFGEYLFHVLGKPTGIAPHSVLEWIESDTGSLVLIAIACLLHARSGLPTAPWLERLLFRDRRARPKPKIWGPGLVGALICLGFFALAQIYQALSGAPALAIAGKAAGGAIPKSAMTTLLLLYPLAFVGAALSEEVIYRFGLMSVLMGLMSFVRVGRRPANNNIAFWISNVLQAGWFGFIHVQQGIVASEAGHGLALGILLAPQTWAGLVFGYVYRRWGLEAAIVAHMATDILTGVFLVVWGMLNHR